VIDNAAYQGGQRLLHLNAGYRPATFTLFGREWDLLDDVFAPVYCYSTQLFAGWLEYPRSGSFLEVGSGAGVAAVMAALGGCRTVTALDINAAAVENTRRNALRHGVQDTVRVLHSDLFDALNPADRFDMIFWNSSFVEAPADRAPASPLEQAIFDPGYRAHGRFLAGAARHLAPGGRIMLGFGSVGHIEEVRRLATDAGLTLRVTHSSGENLVKEMRYELLELTVRTAPTTLPAARRAELSRDERIGFGNALQVARDTSPAPDAPYLSTDRAIVDVDGRPVHVLSLNELDMLAQTWSSWYVEHGVRPRDRVAVYLRDGLDNLLQYLALAQIGAIPVLMNGRMPGDVAARHCTRTGVIGLCTDAEHAERLADVPGLRWTVDVGQVRFAGARPMPAGARYRHAAADPVLICHSSGTTGIPKPVIWTHQQAMVGVRNHLVRFVDGPGSLILSALPQSHASAVGYLVLALLSGVPIVVHSDPSGAAVAEAIGRHRPTVVAAFAGTYAELAATDPGPGDLPTVERWVSVGDASHHAHIARLVAAGRHWVHGDPVPGSMFVDGFGSSELGWGGVLGRVTVSGTQTPDRCIGMPQPRADVRVLRPDGTEADAGEAGLLAVRGDTVTPGYWNDSDTTYRSQLAGFWLSGDVVRRDTANRFYHLDRAVDVIVTAEGRGYSILMEETLLGHCADIEDCTVVAAEVDGRTRPVAVIRPRRPLPADVLERANEALRATGQPPLARLTVGDTPVGVTGKVLKRLLREQFGDGSADASG
jgi:acyl-coenzyme A synthetase/AMP-(fatty) acid ligase